MKNCIFILPNNKAMIQQTNKAEYSNTVMAKAKTQQTNMTEYSHTERAK